MKSAVKKFSVVNLKGASDPLQLSVVVEADEATTLCFLASSPAWFSSILRDSRLLHRLHRALKRLQRHARGR